MNEEDITHPLAALIVAVREGHIRLPSIDGEVEVEFADVPYEISLEDLEESTVFVELGGALAMAKRVALAEKENTWVIANPGTAIERVLAQYTPTGEFLPRKEGR
jgi:hypothetical protein